MLIWYIFLNRQKNDEKTLLWDDDRIKIEHRTDFLQFYVNMSEVCNILPVSTQNESPFTYVLCISVLIYHSKINNIQPVHVLLRNDAKTLRRGRSLTIAVVVTPRSSSIEYSMSVRGDMEINMWLLYIGSTETPQATTKHKLSHPVWPI